MLLVKQKGRREDIFKNKLLPKNLRLQPSQEDIVIAVINSPVQHHQIQSLQTLPTDQSLLPSQKHILQIETQDLIKSSTTSEIYTTEYQQQSKEIPIMSSDLANIVKLYESLKSDFNVQSPDLKKCGDKLAQIKIHLTKMSFLAAGTNKPDEKELLITREILEIGAQWSIRSKNIPSFERYIKQLKVYYTDYKDYIPKSQRQYTLIGLNLLRLLSQNKISEFHTELETIDPNELEQNIYVKHPIQIEQCLMEGSYNKVWNSRANVPAEEYLFFIDILMGTIRNEIASCSEKAYTKLPLADAATLLS